MTTNCMPGPACCLTYSANLVVFALSSAASTSSSTKNGDGEKVWMAKSSAKAAIVFSPPDRCSMSRKRLSGGMAWYRVPER
ncbi:hypothetical protein K461DRAFT_103538 [Myriangium duriaei CBS 260.36]|uniref:Secreted protein n=1 Tax=Myriangium duriaei CBS 260.36 TaxID=1168546 RepID=A0A9P4J3P7_9PEZI|nr:hypothetical protein K461DRAFT_103538 [Myriangium duriaei CBS 260.36]